MHGLYLQLKPETSEAAHMKGLSQRTTYQRLARQPNFSVWATFYRIGGIRATARFKYPLTANAVGRRAAPPYSRSPNITILNGGVEVDPSGKEMRTQISLRIGPDADSPCKYNFGGILDRPRTKGKSVRPRMVHQLRSAWLGAYRASPKNRRIAAYSTCVTAKA